MHTKNYFARKSMTHYPMMSKVTLSMRRVNLEKRLQLAKRGTGGLHATIRYTLLASRVMGLLPVSGLTDPASHKIKFTLRTPYTIFYLTSLIGQLLMFCMSLYWLLRNGISLTNITNSLFYTSSMVSLLILLHIGKFWPKLLLKVEDIESKLPPFTRNVGKPCNITMVFVLGAALVEHLTSVIYGVAVARTCDSSNLGEMFCRYGMPWIFDYISYSLWKGILFEIFNIQSTFLWTYSDLLIMVISIYLAENFIVHKKLLKNALKQEHFSCEEFRTQYLKLFRLVKLFNGRFGIYILTSFGSNLYWICMQLFYSLKKSHTGHFITCQFNNRSKYETLYGLEHSIYFIFSFSFLVARTLLVLLLAAKVHRSSQATLFLLYEIPTSQYNFVVKRYIDQISNLRVALSGLGFFYVTRTMILTVIGTIITYELVLLQFNK